MKKKVCYISVIILILGSLIILLIFNKNTKLEGIYDSVVYIESIDEETIRNGSGFVYKTHDNKNYIITSYHVIEGYDDIYLYNKYKDKIKANILNYDEYTDIAILYIEDRLGLKQISIDNSDKVRIDDYIYVVGTPLNIKNINTKLKGIVSSVNKEITINTTHGSSNLKTIQISAKVEPGNSGSPLLNKNGKVIGMVFVKDENINDVSFALPINFVMNIVKKLENNQLQRPSLGAVMCNTTNIDVLKEYNINYGDVSGVIILDVNDLGVLDNAGLKKGDIITKFDNKQIYNVNKLREELYKKDIGDVVTIEYYRDEIYFSVNIEL